MQNHRTLLSDWHGGSLVNIIINISFHFDIHKTIAYRIINRFVQTKLAGDRPRSNSIGGTFHSDHIKMGAISYNKPALYNI